MKKLIPVFLLLFLIGCEKDYNNVIDVPVNNVQGLSVGTSGTFVYNPSDSLITISMKFQSVAGLTAAYFDIFNPEFTKLNSNRLELFDNGNSANGDVTQGDKIFSNKFPMRMSYLSGDYIVKYYYKDNTGKTYNVAQQSFKYDNGQSNAAPTITNLAMPDTVNFDQSFTFSIQAADSNGLSDISNVYYELFKPDGNQIINSSGLSKFPLYDNGDVTNTGDVNANDGTFTNKLTIPSSQPSGSWTFKFHAVDRGNKFSNEISKILVVQ